MPQDNVFWTFKLSAADKTSAELLFYGPIANATWDGDEVTPKQFAEDLKSLGDISELTIRINSPGGDVFAGNAIYNMLKGHSAKKTIWVDGVAASMASVIAMAGDEVVMPSNAMMMVHNPYCFTSGSSSKLRKTAEMLDKLGESVMAAYAEKTGLAKDKLAELMDAETWMTAAEAVEYGFADRVDEAVKVAAMLDGDTLTINDTAFDLATLNMPSEKIKTLKPVQAKITNPPDKPGKQEESKSMKALAFLAKMQTALSNAGAKSAVDAIVNLKTSVDAEAGVETVMDKVEGIVSESIKDLSAFQAKAAELGYGDIAALESVASQAKDGAAYRAALIEDAHKAGVGAMGAEAYDKDRYGRVFAKASTEEIKAFAADFEKTRAARLGTGGRQIPAGDGTVPADDPQAKALSAAEDTLKRLYPSKEGK